MRHIHVLTVLVACWGCGTEPGGDDPAQSTRALTGPHPGALDPTFGRGGLVTTAIRPNGIPAVALQSDGKIVVASTLADFQVAALVFGVIRYLPSGSLDAGFGKGGVVRTAFTIGFNEVTAVALGAQGKIVVAGSASAPDNSTRAAALARYNADGSLDASFGSGGRVTTSFLGFSDTARVVLVLANGKVLIGGRAIPCFGRPSRCPARTVLARYGATGTLDATFGSGGKVVVDAVGGVDALAIEPDGSILALGLDAPADHRVARFGPDGRPQPLALQGTLTPIAATRNGTFQPDGKVVVGGSAADRTRRDIDAHILRFTLAGAPDPTFSSPIFDFDAAAEGDPRMPSTLQTQAILPSGKIAVAGIAGIDVGVTAFGLAVVAPGGAFDAGFGTAGRVTTRFTGAGDQATGLAVQADGKIIAVGKTSTPGTGETLIALARYFGP